MPIHILDHGVDGVIAEAIEVLRIVLENPEIIAVIPIQPIISAYPQKPIVIFKDRIGRHLGQSFPYAEVFEIYSEVL